MVDKIKIGSFLRELRNEKGLTQEELAEQFSVSSRSVSRWENGNTMPELGILVELASFYDVDVKELIDGERKSEIMEKETAATLTKVADYARAEKKFAIRKKTLVTFLSTLFVLGLAAAFIAVSLSVPLIPVSAGEVSVKSAYRYETEAGCKYFVLFEMPTYGPMEITFDVENGTTLALRPKKTLFGKRVAEYPAATNILVYDCGWRSGDNGGRDFVDFDVVTFAGKEIWSREKDQNDAVPEYVFVYDAFETAGGEVTSWVIEDDYMQAFYADGRTVRWDFAGNVLYDTRER